MSSRPRRSHPKTRTGCRTCKSRKIKCDEQRPSCRNCDKHSVKCDFLIQNAACSSSPPASVPVGPGDDNDLGPGLNVVDLELMHNFCTSTYATLSHDPLLQNMWKTSAVQLALRCDYVLRPLLAVSALHLAHHRPERRDSYISRALLYHQMASKTAISEYSNVTADNIENLQLFSTLTVFFALGSPRRPGGFLFVGEGNFPEWMFLLSGTRFMAEVQNGMLTNGPLGPMFHHGQKRWLYQQADEGSDGEEVKEGLSTPTTPAPGVPAENRALDNLQALLEGVISDPENRNIYLHAVRELRPAYRLILREHHPGDSSAPAPATMDITDAFIWMYKIAMEFLPLLRIPTQEAVAVFAHFCVLLKKVENQWWLNGWADHLISKAYHLLDHVHRLWIQWPMEEIGWMPPPPAPRGGDGVITRTNSTTTMD